MNNRESHGILFLRGKYVILSQKTASLTVSMIPEIKIEDFNYTLPDDRIAKYPLSERDASKLLLGIGAHHGVFVKIGIQKNVGFLIYHHTFQMVH